MGITNELSADHMKKKNPEGYMNQSITTCMAANKVSFVFDFKGPSYVCDTACSTSYTAMVCAFNDLRAGIVEHAIVGATHVLFDPYSTLDFHKFGMLSPEGICKTFNSERNGFVRSEAVVSIFLQKRKNCRRLYATLLGGKINTDGYKKEGITLPSMEAHLCLMKETFADFNIDPSEVTYFETHGTGKVPVY